MEKKSTPPMPSFRICIEPVNGSMLIRHSKYADNNDLPNVPDLAIRM